PHVEMQMVSMLPIGIRSEADRETPAAGIVHRVQEAAHILVRPRPAFEHGDAPPIGEQEGADVDGIGPAMLAEPRAGLVVDRAAGIGAEALDLHYPATEPGPRSEE